MNRRQKENEWKRRWRQTHPKEKALIQKRLCANGANRCMIKVCLAVKKGLLKNLKKDKIKCTDCNERATQYDHRDYNKPLEVDPVCRSCNQLRGPAIPLIVEKKGVKNHGKVKSKTSKRQNEAWQTSRQTKRQRLLVSA